MEELEYLSDLINKHNTNNSINNCTIEHNIVQNKKGFVNNIDINITITHHSEELVDTKVDTEDIINQNKKKFFDLFRFYIMEKNITSINKHIINVNKNRIKKYKYLELIDFLNDDVNVSELDDYEYLQK